MPTTLPPPNDTATLDFNLKYEPSATRPSGTLHVTRGLLAASPPVPAPSAPAPTTTVTPSTTLTPAIPATPAPTPAPTAAPAPVAPTSCQGAAVDPSGPIDFQATGFDWLAITGSIAQFQGVGTVNGCGRYLVAGTATQGAAPATGLNPQLRCAAAAGDRHAEHRPDHDRPARALARGQAAKVELGAQLAEDARRL